MQVAIKEEDKVHEKWYEEAKNVGTPKELAKFADHLINDFAHDYGTICHALAATALAGACCIEHSPQGGITGFQAGAVMWEFMEHWNGPIAPARLIKYEEAMYPQYEHSFKVITKPTWEWMQNRAKELLDEHNINYNGNRDEIKISEVTKKLDKDGIPIHPEVVKHWLSIANGKVPFGLTVEEK